MVVVEGGTEEVVVETSEVVVEVNDEVTGGEVVEGDEVLEVLEGADVLEGGVGCVGGGGGGGAVVRVGGAGGAVSGAVDAVSGKETAEVDVPGLEVCCGGDAATVEAVEPASVEVPQETAAAVRTTAKTPPSRLRKTARRRLEVEVSSKTLVLGIT